MPPAHLRLKLVWRNLSASFESLRGAPPVVDAELIEKSEQNLRDALTALPPFAGRPIQLPDELKAFYLLAQDQLAAGPRSSNQAGSFRFYAVSWLATDGIHLADEAAGDSTPWIEIGAFDDRSWVFICCDPEDPMFGRILPCNDCTPWSRTVYEAETFDSLYDFLVHLSGA